MFYGKRIKELESRVTALQTKVEALDKKVREFARRTDEQVKELEKLFEQQAAEKVKPNKKVVSKPKKNGKENNSAK
jgi:uncharacterized coiled-coil protein SlyX